jgi:hypothetical protein
VKCDGYVSATVSESRAKRKPSKSNTKVKRQFGHPHSPWSIQRSPSRFSSGYESRFFGFYLHQVASSIAGPLPFKDRADLWSVIIPQACEAEPYIRQLVVGIGGLGEVSRTQSSEDSVSRKTYEYSLAEYGKALRSMQEAIAKKSCNLRHAFIACLLIFCFECWQGNSRSALRHALSGSFLVCQWGMDSNVENPDDESHVQENHTSGTFYGIENEIIQAMANLEMHIRFSESWKDMPCATHANLNSWDKIKSIYVSEESQCQPMLTYMPSEFEGFAPLRVCWSLLENMGARLHTLIRSSRKLSVLKDGSYEVESSWLYEKMLAHHEDSRHWLRAAANIFEQIRKEGTQDEKNFVKLLQIQAHHDHLMLLASFMSSPLEHDLMLLEFNTIVELCEDLAPFLSASRFRSGFVTGELFNFDVGIITPLSFVGFYCRDSLIRSRAIDLLRGLCYREGIWDGPATGFVADWLRGIEMEDVTPDGFIPEGKRAVMTLCEVDEDYKTVTLQCRSRGSGLEGEAELITETLDWRFGTGCCRVDCEM